ncbi:MAG: MBL fold metallo-hydrolase [Pseudomonadota bacterium]
MPLIGCTCEVCRSSDPRNHRTRCSALLEIGDTKLLIDTGPDLRAQALAHDLSTVDAVLYTHSHADHLHGIDDVRAFNIKRGGPIDVFADQTTLWHLETRFGYTLQSKPAADRETTWSWWRPALIPNLIDGPFEAAGVPVRPFLQRHGRGTSTGFRVGGFAYSPDVHEFPDDSLAELAGLDVWVVDALRERPHASHAHLERALGWIDQLRPTRAVLTHMNHEVDYATWVGRLPAGVEPAFDGMVLDLPDP